MVIATSIPGIWTETFEAIVQRQRQMRLVMAVERANARKDRSKVKPSPIDAAHAAIGDSVH